MQLLLIILGVYAIGALGTYFIFRILDSKLPPKDRSTQYVWLAGAIFPITWVLFTVAFVIALIRGRAS